MTYQELIRCYPWFDLVLELFKGIMPTVVALFAIFMNNFLSKKRDLVHRKKSLQLDYFVKILNWLHEMKNDIMEVSLELEKVLSRMNPDEQINRYNDFIKSISKMNRCFVSWGHTYSVVLESYNCDIKLTQFKQEMKDCSDNLVKIGKHYLNQVDTTMATDEINKTVIRASKVMEESIWLLLKEMNTLY